MKYIKLNLTFGDRIKLLFFGIIPENKLPVIEVVKETEKIIEYDRSSTIVPTPSNINNNEEFNVPFFDLQKDDVKSNF